LAYDPPTENSTDIRSRVIAARLIQQRRYSESTTHCNAHMQRFELIKYCAIDDPSKQLLKNAMDRLGLSARAYDRILKVARTIADLSNEDTIQPKHLSEAIQLRNLDRDNWAG
jgi:magnesium chelatase family protein